MKIIRPITITDAMLTSSNVPETDYAEWSVITPYVIEDRCIVTTAGIHKIYECITNVTGGDSPEIDVLVAVPKWLEVSSTNRWKAFDAMVGSQAAQADSITYKLTPGQVFDSIAFLNLDAVSVQIVMTDPLLRVAILAEDGSSLVTEDGDALVIETSAEGGEIYNETIDLQTTVITGTTTVMDWYTYFFSSIIKITDAVKFDVVPYLNAIVDITITYTGETAKVGAIILGLQTTLGETEYGASVGIHDYSTKEADTFGVYNIVPRAYSRKMSCDLAIPNTSISEILNLLAFYRAIPLVWVGSVDYSALIIYGYYKDFSIVISYPNWSECSIDIEGLI